MAWQSFGRSNSVLERDRYKTARWVMLPLFFLLVAWLVWFFFAQITLYEVGPAQITKDSSAGKFQITGEFSPYAALVRIRANQPATLTLDGFPVTAYANAHVVSIDETVDSDGQIPVELSIDNTNDLPLQPLLKGEVTIEVDHVSPMALLLRMIFPGQV